MCGSEEVQNYADIYEWSLIRAAIIGKTGKTSVLPRFYGKERGGGWCGGLAALSKIDGGDPVS